MGRQRHIRALRREINEAVRLGAVTALGALSAKRVAKGRAPLNPRDPWAGESNETPGSAANSGAGR